MNYNENDNNRYVLFGSIVAILSFVVGFFAHRAIDKRKPINADRILDRVKAQFKEDGPIEGSWIEMTKVPWKKYSYDTKVYYGGISRHEEGKIAQYEFVADAYTGSIMDLYKI